MHNRLKPSETYHRIALEHGTPSNTDVLVFDVSNTTKHRTLLQDVQQAQTINLEKKQFFVCVCVCVCVGN